MGPSRAFLARYWVESLRLVPNMEICVSLGPNGSQAENFAKNLTKLERKTSCAAVGRSGGG